MSKYTQFFSSSKRPILVGKTITKQLGSKKEFDDYIRVTNALKAAGVYEIFTYNPIDLTVTYDYIEGSENQDITKFDAAIKMISAYSKPIKAELMTVDKMHETIGGFKWSKNLYDLCKGQMNCLAHGDVNRVNIIKTSSGYEPIDWERACLAPQYYDLGSWLVNQVMYSIDDPKKKVDVEKIIKSKVGSGPMADLAMRYALIDAMFIQSYKLQIAKQRKVYGLTGLERIINYLSKVVK